MSITSLFDFFIGDGVLLCFVTMSLIIALSMKLINKKELTGRYLCKFILVNSMAGILGYAAYMNGIRLSGNLFTNEEVVVFKTLFLIIVYTAVVSKMYMLPFKEAMRNITFIYLLLFIGDLIINVKVFRNGEVTEAILSLGEIAVANICVLISFAFAVVSIVSAWLFEKYIMEYIRKIKFLIGSIITVINLIFVGGILAGIMTYGKIFVSPERKDIFPMIGMVVFVLFIYINTSYNVRLNSSKKENKELKDYIENIDELNLELRRFRHNYINILTTFNGYVALDDKEGFAKYFNDVVDQCGSIRNVCSSGVVNLLDIPLKSIVAVKVGEAAKNSIGIEVFSDENFKIDKMSLCDVCEIVGVFLDNALEECKNIKKGNKKISISFIKQDEYLEINIKNDYKKEPNLSEIEKVGFSTKGENRGLGLNTVRRIIQRHDNVTLTTKLDKKNNKFIQKLIIEL